MTLKQVRPDLELHGVDPSGQMLEIAQRRVAEAGVADGVTFQLGYAEDVAATPLYDAATLINVLHFVPDDGSKAALLGDIARRMKPGGVLVFFDLHGGAGPEEHERYLSAWRRYWTIRGMTGDEKRRFDARIREGIHFAPASRVVELARKAGLVEPRRFQQSLLYGGWTFRRAGGNASVARSSSEGAQVIVGDGAVIEDAGKPLARGDSVPQSLRREVGVPLGTCRAVSLV